METLIRSGLEELWQATQDPSQHQRWDLRFSRIEYLPRPDEAQPQRFLYATRIGFGVEIRGEGESVGERDDGAGSRASALKFWSRDPRSLIRVGSGFWKYVPTDEGVRFLTLYDYDVRYGAAGRIVDRLFFRPLLGWATAWSFDRLRLWLEEGIPPALSIRLAWTYLLARASVALVWVYHGLVPKLMARHPDELALLARAGIPDPSRAAAIIGVAEILFGVLTLILWTSRWPLIATILLMAGALVEVALTAPLYLGGAFNPVSLNLCVAALSAIGLLSLRYLPLARRCLRRPIRKSAP